VEDAREPLDLMVQAINVALEDTGLDSAKSAVLQSAIDSVNVVASWTWPYPDLVGSVAERLGVDPRYKVLSPHGGNKPGKLFDEAARRISQGTTKVAVLTGGEALASCVSTPKNTFKESC
jgi:acetyl-CoA acetyltransferase